MIIIKNSRNFEIEAKIKNLQHNAHLKSILSMSKL